MTTNFAARLADMEDLERAYRAADPEDRLALHRRLRFHALLSPLEHVALERRFPGELERLPDDPDLDPEDAEIVAIAWDYRARELVLAMLGYADEVLAAGLDLVGRLAPEDPRAALALTATGSIVEVHRPASGGLRAWAYRPSARPDRGARLGHAVLREPLVLGDRVRLGDLVTSELLVLAAGPSLPEVAAPARFLLGADDPELAPAAALLDDLRFRVLADAVLLVEPEDRPAAEARLVDHALRLQHALGPGHRLEDLAELTTSWGVSYQIHPTAGGRFTLIGKRPQDPDDPVVVPAVDIGEQRVVPGAPLVLHIGSDGRLGPIARVASVVPSPA